MRVTVNYHEFFRTTRMIFDHTRLQDLGLDAVNIGGLLWPNEVEDVLDFCTKKLSFHIVSYMGEGIFINRYENRGRFFYLAEGDSDPCYLLDTKHLYHWMFDDDDPS